MLFLDNIRAEVLNTFRLFWKKVSSSLALSIFRGKDILIPFVLSCTKSTKQGWRSAFDKARVFVEYQLEVSFTII